MLPYSALYNETSNGPTKSVRVNPTCVELTIFVFVFQLETCTELDERLRIRRALRKIRSGKPTGTETPTAAYEERHSGGQKAGTDSQIRRVLSLHEHRAQRRSSLKVTRQGKTEDAKCADPGAKRLTRRGSAGDFFTGLNGIAASPVGKVQGPNSGRRSSLEDGRVAAFITPKSERADDIILEDDEVSLQSSSTSLDSVDKLTVGGVNYERRVSERLEAEAENQSNMSSMDIIRQMDDLLELNNMVSNYSIKNMVQ